MLEQGAEPVGAAGPSAGIRGWGARAWRAGRRPRVFVPTLVVALLIAGGGVYWSRQGGGSAGTAPSYRLVAASTGTVRESVAATGTIEPAEQESLNFGVSGQVTSVRVTAGQKVKAGAVLATVDAASLQADLAQAQATLAGDQARVASDTNAGASATQLAADSAAVTAAQGQVTAAQKALGQAKLTSPITGVVASMKLSVGQQVSGGSGSSAAGSAGSGSSRGSASSGSASSASSSGSSNPQVLVISTDSWVVNASVDSTGVGLIAKGDQAQIVPGSASGTVYGTIASVGLIASSSSGVASFPVVVAVTGNPSGLHAGDTATVSLIYKQLSNVLTVPSAAVHTQNGKRVVYVESGARQVARIVTVGLSSGGSTQITSGLAAGEQVVVQVPRSGPASGGSGSAGERTTRGNLGRGRFGGGGGGFGGGGGLGGGGFGRGGN